MLPVKSAASKSIRKVERPRPLKWMSEVGDEVLQELDAVVKHLSNCNYDTSLLSSILKISHDLKTFGPMLESKHSFQLDRHFVVLRNAAGDELIDPVFRLRLLELIELRSMGWKGDETFENNYKNRLFEAESVGSSINPSISVSLNTANVPHVFTFPSGTSSSLVNNSNNANAFAPVTNCMPQMASVSVLAPGEVIKSSGKYPKPTKIPAKNYYKDEIVIRNADSGKVMGIKGRRVHMIEELSGTVVSFQRVVQGVKDRLVQVTGPTEESIGRAKVLIDDTIRRNTSPVRVSERAYPIQTSETSTCLLSSLYRDDDACQHVFPPPSLMHSYSMNDASIGEYQYTVSVGQDTLKLSGLRLDLVRIAKLVLEEYFAGDAKRTLHESVEDEDVFESFDANEKLHSDSTTSSLTNEQNGCGVDGMAKKFSSLNPFLTSNDDGDDSSSDDDATFVQVIKGLGEDLNHSGQNSASTIAYHRDFLLMCALSPLSKREPEDYARMKLSVAEILKENSGNYFDPKPHRQLKLNPIIISSGLRNSYRSGSWSASDSMEKDAATTMLS